VRRFIRKIVTQATTHPARSSESGCFPDTVVIRCRQNQDSTGDLCGVTGVRPRPRRRRRRM